MNITAEEFNLIKKRKYGNKSTKVDGLRMDSKKEARRYSELKILERLGEITELQRQVSFELLPKQNKGKVKEQSVKYIADFVYYRGKELIVEDVKSAPTKKLSTYIIKRKLMLFIHGIAISEL